MDLTHTLSPSMNSSGLSCSKLSLIHCIRYLISAADVVDASIFEGGERTDEAAPDETGAESDGWGKETVRDLIFENSSSSPPLDEQTSA